MSSTIEVRGVHKRYGSSVAVDDLTFTVQPGRVTGFVGPNGSGKSTTMRLILGLDAADAGTTAIGGHPFRSLPSPLTRVGALLDAAAVHPGRRAYHHLLWLAHSNGLPKRRIREVLGLVGLDGVAGKRVGGFSLGMRQRLGIAAALLGDPPVVMLDEPVNGLDPDGIVWFRDLARRLAAEGRTVFVASHLMGELEGTASHLVVIGRGRLIADAAVADLLDAASGERLEIRTTRRTEVMTVLANAGATVAATGPEALTVTGLGGERVTRLLGDAGLEFAELRRHRATLEEAYMELTRDAVTFR